MTDGIPMDHVITSQDVSPYAGLRTETVEFSLSDTDGETRDYSLPPHVARYVGRVLIEGADQADQAIKTNAEILGRKKA